LFHILSDGNMTTNWLELMGDDSDLSMTCLDDDLSRQTDRDPELDHSRQGVNLLFKKQIKIISEDSQSRKRTLNEMASTDTDDTLREMSKLPPKAKQRTDDEGHWAHRKDGACNENAKPAKGKIGFSHFLKWAPKGSAAGNRAILGSRSRTNNNRANTMANAASVAPLTALVTCAPGKTRSRKLSRGRRSRKNSPRKTPTPTPTQTPSQTPTPSQTRAESRHTQSTDDHKEDIATPAIADTAAIKNTQSAEKEIEIEKEDEKEEVGEEDVDVDVDMAEVEPSDRSGPVGTRLENAVCAEAVIDVDANACCENDADDEDEDEDDETEQPEKGKADEKEKEDEKDEDEDEDVDLTPADRRLSVGRRSRSSSLITLSNVVFNTDLIRNKVPILRKKSGVHMKEPVKAMIGPIFLNGDQYDKLYPKDEQRDSRFRLQQPLQQLQPQQLQQPQQQQSPALEGQGAGQCKAKQDEAQQAQPQQPKQAQPAKQAGPAHEQTSSKVSKSQHATPIVHKQKEKQPKPQRQGPLSWASKLFGRGGVSVSASASRPEKQKQMAMEESNARRIMLSRESSVHSVQSEQTADSAQSGESQQSKGSHVGMMSLGMGISVGRVSTNISRVGSPKSVGSRASTVSVVCAPSEGATKWRQKQIQYGTNTEGYKNFTAQYPNKDALFRLSHEFVPSPDPKEKIGKKRWVGKYQKWRKFLHKFDTASSASTPETQTKEADGEEGKEQSL